MDERLFSVCVNAAGCLPDAEDMPYAVSGLLGAEAALKTELERAFGEEDHPGHGDLDTIEAEALESLRTDEAASVDLRGTYILTITRMTDPANCDNCDRKWSAGVPAGECPVCGALAYPIPGEETETVLVKANSHRAREKLFREIGEDNTQALTSMRRETGKGVFRIPAELEERARAIKGMAGFRDGDDLFNCWPKTNRED